MCTGAGMGAGAGTGAAAAWREPEPRRADSAADAATGATADAAAVWERMAGPLRHLHSTVLRRGFGRPLLSDGGPERERESPRAGAVEVGRALQTGYGVATPFGMPTLGTSVSAPDGSTTYTRRSSGSSEAPCSFTVFIIGNCDENNARAPRATRGHTRVHAPHTRLCL